jgi:hypothetical protein
MVVFGHVGFLGGLTAGRTGAYISDTVRLQVGESMTARKLQGRDPEMAEAKAVLVRLPDEVLARVEAQRQRLRLTGLTPSLSATIKQLIVRGLEVVEVEAAQPPRKR